jgi:chemotaxis protein histidine kinase CheA
MLDKELEAKLLMCTGHDNDRAPADALKEVVRAAQRGRESTLLGMARWLADRLQTDHCGAKIKVLRLMMTAVGSPTPNPKSRKFAEALRSEALGTVQATIHFHCAPDPEHGTKPAEFVRSLAAKCAELLQPGSSSQAGPASSPPRSQSTPPPSPPRPSPPSSPSVPARTASLSPTPSPMSTTVPTLPTTAPDEAALPPVSEATGVLRDFSKAIQIDFDDRQVLRLPLGGSMEEELESRQKKWYTFEAKTEHRCIDFGFTVLSDDLHVGLFWTEVGGDVSYPLAGWEPRRFDIKELSQKGCFAVPEGGGGGQLTLQVDNTSRLRSKSIRFVVQSREMSQQGKLDRQVATLQARKRGIELPRPATPKTFSSSSSGGAKGMLGRRGSVMAAQISPAVVAPVVTAAEAAAAAYAAAEAAAGSPIQALSAVAETAAADEDETGMDGGQGAGLWRAGRGIRPGGKKRVNKSDHSPAGDGKGGAGGPVELGFMQEAEAQQTAQLEQQRLRRSQALANEGAMRKSLMEEEQAERAVSRAEARRRAKQQAAAAREAAAAERLRAEREQAEADAAEEAAILEFQRSQEAAERLDVEAARAQAQAEERRRLAAEANERRRRALLPALTPEAQIAKAELEARKAEAAAELEAAQVAAKEQRRQREEEAQQHVEIYSLNGKLLRTLQRYTCAVEGGVAVRCGSEHAVSASTRGSGGVGGSYISGWACDVCLKVKVGTFFWDATNAETDVFRACAGCLMKAGLISEEEYPDLDYGFTDAELVLVELAPVAEGIQLPSTGPARQGSGTGGARLVADSEDDDSDDEVGGTDDGDGSGGGGKHDDEMEEFSNADLAAMGLRSGTKMPSRRHSAAFMRLMYAAELTEDPATLKAQLQMAAPTVTMAAAKWAGRARKAVGDTSAAASPSGAKEDDRPTPMVSVYVRPGRWQRVAPAERFRFSLAGEAAGGGDGGGGVGGGASPRLQLRWEQVGERFEVRVPKEGACWSDLVDAIAAHETAQELTVVGGGDADGAAFVPLDDGHPDLAAVNFFNGKLRKRIVSASEYGNFPIPYPGQAPGVGDSYGVLTRSLVLDGGATMGEIVSRHRSEVRPASQRCQSWRIACMLQ